MVNIFSAPVVELKELNNLFIELTAKNCNQRCKHCYIDFPVSKNVKDFISIDKIREVLKDTIDENINCIYLTGAEPMTHPEFNSILRLCLKRANVCICTNSSFINEKKARFLKKVEDEGPNEIIFKLSLDHYNEVKNDDIRGRGSYRQVVNALKSLIKYNFNPIINVVNYYKVNKQEMFAELCNLYEKIGLVATDFNIKINEYYDKYHQDSEFSFSSSLPVCDCQDGRILTAKGVYVCPFLSNDHRGWMGVDFKNYSKKMYLESNYCNVCLKNKSRMFGIDFSLL